VITTADTNVIVRIIEEDDRQQTAAALNLMAKSTKVVIPAVVFCEVAWVLRSVYKRNWSFIAMAIRSVLENSKVVAEDDAVLAGLRMLDDGGDFADGVVQYTGSLLAGGPSTYASFDQAAVSRLVARGIAAMIPQPA
jgi:predicted nucleic-acid-binding protein